MKLIKHKHLRINTGKLEKESLKKILKYLKM